MKKKIKPASTYCPKCQMKKYVARSMQAGYRWCVKCRIKWRMDKPFEWIKLQ